MRLPAIACAALVATVASIPNADGQETPAWVNSIRVSGLAFGDAYAVVAHHDADIENANGAWLRRAYLTFNARVAESTDVRLRFEAASPGDFTTSAKISPFVKDAWIRWRFPNNSVYVGLSSSPTWDLPEGVWGYRHVEKTALDLFKFGSSRDFGVALKGQTESGLLRYHFMVGNGSGTKSETNEGKKFMGAVSVHTEQGFIAQAYADFDDRPGGTDRFTLKGFAAWQSEAATIGAMLTRQHRQVELGPDLDLELLSVFGTYRVNDRVALLGRYDRGLDPMPGATGISYLVLDDTADPNLILAGVDLTVDGNFHLIPNIEAVFYSADGGAPTPDTDVIGRVTFSVRF
ncbi:MAG: hypothetical protein ACE5FJ_05315 [Gemmatimonadales bacterium]